MAGSTKILSLLILWLLCVSTRCLGTVGNDRIPFEPTTDLSPPTYVLSLSLSLALSL